MSAECAACRLVFGSNSAFDHHRVGKHEYLFSLWDEARADGRRCLQVPELVERGWVTDRRGKWRQPPPPRSRPLTRAAV